MMFLYKSIGSKKQCFKYLKVAVFEMHVEHCNEEWSLQNLDQDVDLNSLNSVDEHALRESLTRLPLANVLKNTPSPIPTSFPLDLAGD